MSNSSTHTSLFAALQEDPRDAATWAKIVDRYGPLIYGWARARRLGHEDAEDVMLNVLTRLLTVLETFEYDRSRSFRGFLCRVTQRAVSDFLDVQRRQPSGGKGAAVVAALEAEEARSELWQRLEQEYDLELFEQGCRRVELQVSKEVWQRFQATLPERLGGLGLDDDEAAHRLGVRVALIYQARYKLRPKLVEAIRRLGGNDLLS
jgi:RNA polymerase sigma-70 factor (ECF subfamily)